MRPRSPLFRAGWLFFTLLHVVVLAAAEVAEARLVAAEAGAQAHVESESYECSTLVHSDACAIHHFLSAPQDPPHRAPRFAPSTDGAGTGIAPATRTRFAAAASRPELPRAPPSFG